MAVLGVGNSYNNVYQDIFASRKNEAERKGETKNDLPVQEGEQAVSDYYSRLTKNYGCMSKGNVEISSEYLKTCAGDSKKAKELEDFLQRIPELEKQGYEQLSAQNKAMGGTVTYYQQTWAINKDGSIQSTVYSVTETEMTNAERMKKGMEERLEKQKEKKEEEKRAEKKKEEKAGRLGKPDGGTKIISVLAAAGQKVAVRYVEAGSEQEARAKMQKGRQEDAYRPGFDRNI